MKSISGILLGEEKRGQKGLLESISKVGARWLALCCVGVLMAWESVCAQERGMLPDETLFAVVRVDLEAGAFLDRLPFDRPFFLVGRAPSSTEAVGIQVREFLAEPVVPSEPQVKRFEAKLGAYLEQALVRDSVGMAEVGFSLERLRLNIIELLLEEVQIGGFGHSLGQIWRYVPPWNWKNWGDRSRDRRSAVVAPGTAFDLDAAAGGAALKRLIEAYPSTARTLAGRIAEEARSVEVVVFRASRSPQPAVRWTRLGAVGGGATGGEALAAESVGIWNRLERIGALTGTSVLDQRLFAGPGPGSRGAAEAWLPFRVLIQPLEAGRYYRFEFKLERKPAEAEVTAFVNRAGMRADEVLAKTTSGSFSEADGQRLHGVLTETLHGAVGKGWRAAPGSLFYVEIPYAGMHPHMMGLAENWWRAAEEGRATGALADRFEEMVRGQRLMHDKGFGASTAANDYISGDVGLLYAGVIGKTVAYVGVNFYLRPVDKGVPLRQQGGFGRRFAWTVGLTLHSIEDQRGTRSDLYFNQALVLGAGYRLSQSWRLGGGGLLFRERIPDAFPLTHRKRLAMTPYVSLAFDADIGRQLSGAGRIFHFLKDGQ